MIHRVGKYVVTVDGLAGSFPFFFISVTEIWIR